MVGPFSAWSVLEQSSNSVGEAQNPTLLRLCERRSDLNESLQSETRGLTTLNDGSLDVRRTGMEKRSCQTPYNSVTKYWLMSALAI